MNEKTTTCIIFDEIYDSNADVWIATSDAHRMTTEAATKDLLKERLRVIVPDVLESRASEIITLKAALAAVIDATGAYLQPDGITATECISRILGATDNPEINAIMLR